MYNFIFSYYPIPAEGTDAVIAGTQNITVQIRPSELTTNFRQCSVEGNSPVTTPGINLCTILTADSTTEAPLVCPVLDDEQTICYALSSSPNSLTDDVAKLYRLTQSSSLERAFIDGVWSPDTGEYPVADSELIDYDYSQLCNW